MENFTYECIFAAPPDILSKRTRLLLLRGVDTVATLTLNGHPLAHLDNAHRTWVVRVPPAFLSADHNRLTVAFTGPVPASLAAEAACAAANGGLCSDAACVCPAPWPGPAPSPLLINAFIRKEQQSFSWDFAPATGTSGLSVAPLLVAFDTALLRDAVIATEPVDGGAWHVAISARIACINSPLPASVPAVLTASMPAFNATARVLVDLSPPDDGSGVCTSRLVVVVPALGTVGTPPALWWPHGYGEATLHNLSLTLTAADGSEASSLNLRVGLRTVVLDQSRVPGQDSAGDGHLFRLLVNGRPIHARGSNWVPPASLAPRVTDTLLVRLFDAFERAHFCVLRVWGGGVYASDALMDLADEAGIIILHDVQLGDQFYPTTPAFLSNIANEVRDAAWRLGRHASLAAYFGSNEMAAGYSDDHHFFSAAPFYSRLYFDTVLSNLSVVDPSRILLSSTPSNGNESASHPFSTDAEIEARGDIHWYALDSDCFNTSDAFFPRPRWVTESGWQSTPSLLTLAPTLRGEEDMSFNSSVMVSRQHHPPGQGQMTRMVTTNWLWPDGLNPRARYSRLEGAAAAEARRAHASLTTDALALSSMLSANGTTFRDELWMTQVAAGTCLHRALTYWRSLADEFDDNTTTRLGGTAGILYWQATDTWPAPSWSTIELSGRAKVGHHLAARAFAPLLVSPSLREGGNTLVVHVSRTTYEGGAASRNGTLLVHVWSWARGALATTPYAITLPAPHTTVRVLEAPLDALLSRTGCPSRAECVVSVEAIDASRAAFGAEESFVFLTPPRTITTMVRDPSLRVTDVVATAGGAFNVTLTASSLPVAVVWLETALEGAWSDGGFLLTTPQRVLTWTPADGVRVDAGQLAASLAVSSLVDVAGGYSNGH